MKPTTIVLGNFSAQGFNPRFFCRAGFLGLLGPNDIQLGIPNDHVSEGADDKTLVRVSTTRPNIRASVQV